MHFSSFCVNPNIFLPSQDSLLNKTLSLCVKIGDLKGYWHLILGHAVDVSNLTTLRFFKVNTKKIAVTKKGLNCAYFRERVSLPLVQTS